MLVAGAALAVACATEGSAPETPPEIVRLADGTELSIHLGTEARRDEQDGRVALRLQDGLMVAVQEVEIEDRATGGRTPRSVAAALVERVQLGEREGSLTHHACRAGERDAECVDGWMVSAEGERVARHGVVLFAGARIVWVDVSGPEERAEDVQERARRIRQSLRVIGGAS